MLQYALVAGTINANARMINMKSKLAELVDVLESAVRDRITLSMESLSMRGRQLLAEEQAQEGQGKRLPCSLEGRCRAEIEKEGI